MPLAFLLVEGCGSSRRAAYIPSPCAFLLLCSISIATKPWFISSKVSSPGEWRRFAGTRFPFWSYQKTHYIQRALLLATRSRLLQRRTRCERRPQASCRVVIALGGVPDCNPSRFQTLA